MLNIQYRDTQRMQTWGGVVVDEATEHKFRLAAFPTLSHVQTGADALVVNVPVLTAREVLELESQLVSGGQPPTLSWLKSSESESFAELHRWYPPVPAPM